MPTFDALPADQPFDRVVVGDERGDLRVRDPFEHCRVVRVEVRAHRVDLHGIRVAVPLEDLRRETGVEEHHVARFHNHVVGRHDLLERRAVDTAKLVPEVMRKVDEHAATLHAMEGHVLQAEMLREARVVTAVACGIFLRPDEVVAGAVAVVVDGFLDTVAVGVELRARVRERVPLRRVLQRERHDVVGPHVDVPRAAVLRDLALVDVVEDLGIAVEVFGRREARRIAALVQRGAAGEIERQAEAEADAGLDLAHALQAPFRG